MKLTLFKHFVFALLKWIFGIVSIFTNRITTCIIMLVNLLLWCCLTLSYRDILLQDISDVPDVTQYWTRVNQPILQVCKDGLSVFCVRNLSLLGLYCLWWYLLYLLDISIMLLYLKGMNCPPKDMKDLPCLLQLLTCLQTTVIFGIMKEIEVF